MNCEHEKYLADDLRLRELTQGYDALGRLNAVSTRLATQADPSPAWQAVISAVSFHASGGILSLNHLGQTETRQYNVLGQLTRLSKGTLIDVEYRYSATANDGKITSQKNWLTGEDVSYQYDELERLIAAQTTVASAPWGLAWSYDGFGNRLSQTVTQGTGPQSVQTVNPQTNRIQMAGYNYDANGNLTQMPKGTGAMTLNYDLSNRLSSVAHPDGNESYVYAPDNRRVWRNAGKTACRAGRGNNQEYFWSGYGPGEVATEQLTLYSPSGQKLGVYCVVFSDNMQWSAVTASEENVYYGSRLVGKRILAQSSGSGTVSDFTTDRLQSKGNGSQYFPYGESRSSSPGDDRENFATYSRDSLSGLDYADQRYYAPSLGRFLTPDPYLASSGGIHNPSHPSSWNKHPYVEGDPVNFMDQPGLYMHAPGSSPGDPDGPGVSGRGGGDLGGAEIVLDLPGAGGSSDQLTISDLRKEGEAYDTVRRMYNTLLFWIDEKCRVYLQSGGFTVREYVNQMLQYDLLAVGQFSAQNIAAINGTAGANLQAGTASIVVNANGAFFNSSFTVDDGRVRGGSERAHILLHELGHGLGAAGFLHDHNDAVAGKANDKLIRENCKMTLDHFRN